MPSYVPRNEPIKKVEILEKRINDLQKSKRSNHSVEKINNKCEKVRTAKLNLIKARLSLLKSYRHEDESKLKVIEKLEGEYDGWESLSIEQIKNEVCD